MARWRPGERDVEQLIASGSLDVVTGAAADGRGWLDQSMTALDSADRLRQSDPRMTCVAAYDAARLALTALLVQQGLRPTSAGGHLCLVHACRAQFGEAFADFDGMRRRRNEIEYPRLPAQAQASLAEAEAMVDSARVIIEAADQLIDNLGFFR